MNGHDDDWHVGFSDKEFLLHRAEQATDSACWAACIETVFASLGRTWTQDDINLYVRNISYAGAVQDIKKAMEALPRSANDPRGWPLRVYEVHPTEIQHLVGALSCRCPVIFGLAAGRAGAPGHAVVAYRIDLSPRRPAIVWVCDPAPGRTQPWSIQWNELVPRLGTMIVFAPRGT